MNKVRKNAKKEKTQIQEGINNISNIHINFIDTFYDCFAW